MFQISARGFFVILGFVTVAALVVKEAVSNMDRIQSATSTTSSLVVTQQQTQNYLENGYEIQDDLALVEHIRRHWLVPPSRFNLSLLFDLEDYSQFGQSRFVDKELGEKAAGGFFVECGAADGETLSNSLFFERKRGWSGLLIEPNPLLFEDLLSKNRRAHAVNSCLSTSGRTGRVEIIPAGVMGGIAGSMDAAHMRYINSKADPNAAVRVQVQCFALYSILLALGRTKIDYFSLDVEGAEIGILESIPLNEVYIELIGVEYRSSDGATIDERLTVEKLARVRRFFRQTGLYREVGIVPWGEQDNPEGVEARGLDVFFRRVEQSVSGCCPLKHQRLNVLLAVLLLLRELRIL